jgi:glutamine amidotransferase
MSANHPTDVNHSLALLKPRGGKIGPHADGWGVAFYEGRAARIFKEPVPAAESRCLAFIAEYDFQSTTVIAHIRKANPEKIGRASANTHPFEREWNGRSWVFAHNGKLPGLREDHAFGVERFQPLGETDSEYAFCLLLDAIVAASAAGGNTLVAVNLVEIIEPLVERLCAFGEFNFILSDGESLIVHAHTNLHALHRTCGIDNCAQKVVLLATSPLTDEPWVRLENGSIHVYSNGMATVLAESSDLLTLPQNLQNLAI